MRGPDINVFAQDIILLEWPEKIDVKIHDEVLRYHHYVLTLFKEEVINATPAYNSLLIQSRSLKDRQYLVECLNLVDHESLSDLEWKSTRHTIHVSYHQKDALDLEVFESKGIDRETLIQLHTEPIYRVYFIGFLPGFPYLGGLNPKLHMPRKNTPRTRVPKGSVAIGGQQTGIYPQSSPGGWQIIGRTDVDLFFPKKNPPVLLKPGDEVVFRAL